MKMNKKTVITLTISVVVIAVLISLIFRLVGGNLDVVGQASVKSFDQVLKTIPGQVIADDVNVGWSLAAPGDPVRFIWSEDYSKSPLHDIMMEFDAAPFLAAGLDPDELPENYSFYNGMLMVGSKLGDDRFADDSDATAIAAYEQIVRKYRSVINYHTSLDHFGVMLGDGNMFEWARDLSTNTTTGDIQDKDIVFVLNPEPLIAAGVDPAKLTGWVYLQVSAEENGKPVQVYKFLKPFNIG